jgi:hypothetical protein
MTIPTPDTFSGSSSPSGPSAGGNGADNDQMNPNISSMQFGKAQTGDQMTTQDPSPSRNEPDAMPNGGASSPSKGTMNGAGAQTA